MSLLDIIIIVGIFAILLCAVFCVFRRAENVIRERVEGYCEQYHFWHTNSLLIQKQAYLSAEDMDQFEREKVQAINMILAQRSKATSGPK